MLERAAATTPQGDATAPTNSSLIFIAVAPCRVMDTRAGSGKTGAFGAPSLIGGEARKMLIQNSDCGVPAAAAYSMNFALIAPSGASVGYLSAWPDDQPWPGTVVLNAPQGGIIDNSAIVPAGSDGGIQVLATDPTDLVIDINGYFIDRLALNYKGTWNKTASYSAGDVVSFATTSGPTANAASSYIAVVASQGVDPYEDSAGGNSHWAILAEAGQQGSQGFSGPPGATGPAGVAGPAGTTGAAGAQGPIGLTGPAGPAGTTGAAGSQGPIGLTGPAGPAGTTGAAGSQGPIGLTGPVGPAGATGPAGSSGSTFLLSGVTDSTGATMTTIAGGLAGTGAVLPLSGSITTATSSTFSGGVPITFQNVMQVFPSAVTFSSMSGNFVNGIALALIGSTVTLQAQLYKVVSGTATAVPGFNCTFAPALTGIAGVGDTSSCLVTGASATFAAGDSGFVAVSATASGITLINTVSGSISVGIGQ